MPFRPPGLDHPPPPVRVTPSTPLLPLPALGLMVGALLFAALTACAPQMELAPAPSPAEIPALEDRLAERPDDANTLTRLGVAYREAGRLDDARVALDRARERAPDNAAVLFYLGVTAEEQEDWGVARDAYQAFLQVDADPVLHDMVRKRMPVVRRAHLVAQARDAVDREMELVDREPTPGTVAVFPYHFEGVDPELAPLGRALAELTVTDLVRVGRLSVLERLHVQLLIEEMELAEEGLVDPSTAARSGRMLGADRIIQGSFDADQERVDVLAAAVATLTGDAPDPVAEEDALERLYELQGRMVVALHGALGIQLTDAERDLIMDRPTRSLRALLLLGQALEAEDRGDYQEAAELYEQVLVEEPGFEVAEDGWDRSRDAAEGAEVSPSELAFEGRPQVPPPPPGILDPRDVFRDVEAIIPAPEGRDPSAELLGQEGIRASPAVIDLILRPSGGDQ